MFHFRLIALVGIFAAPLAHANVIGVDTQNFNATTNGLDFVTVQSSETLDPGVFNLGLFVNHAVNSLPYFPADEKNATKRERFKDHLTGADINMGVGIMRNWDVGISFPQVLAQSVRSDEFRGQFGENGLTEIRLNTKIRLLGNDSGGAAIIATINNNMIRDNPWTGTDAGPTLNGELALDTMFGATAVGLNLGYRSRSPGKALEGAPVEPLDDQYIASTAASVLIKPIHSKLIGEIYLSQPVARVSSRSDRQLTSAEALLGLKHDASRNLALHAGVGTELTHGIASPDYRLYAGVNYTFGPLFQKKKIVRKRRAKRPRPAERPPIEDFRGSDNEQDFPIADAPLENPFASTPEPGVETIVIQDVHFAFDKDNVVLPGTRRILEQLHEYLMREPRYQSLSIEGHTDYMGTDTYNQDLSERRARTIRRYMVEVFKLPTDTVEAWGFGEARPIADNGNYQGRQLNRRVEFRITR